MAHNFRKFPELTNNQMQFYYLESPHKQITEDFIARVVRVHDGDSIRVVCNFRDFSFPVKLKDIQAPELREAGGLESKSWLADKILGAEVELQLGAERVDKWGRILARVFFNGVDINEESVLMGKSVWWEDSVREQLPDLNKEMRFEKWLTS